jgi:hypothetical protein
MLMFRTIVLTICVLAATPAFAQDAPRPLPELGDVVYKGVVGKALDAVPMDADKRTTLQRTNAVVSNTLTGRTLSAWVGLSHPLLMIAGLVWGIYSATNIQPANIEAKPERNRLEPIEGAYSQLALRIEQQPQETPESGQCL